MAYKKTYNPCDDCPYSFSKNNQESNTCKICEFKELLDKYQNDTRTPKERGERCGNKDNQAEFLKSHMNKIFGSDGYPNEWVDKLAEQGEEA